MSKYSSAIAGAMGLHGDMLRQIELGGHVHDIGKIGVRETVLNKAERLTAEEYEHIMTHPVLGWRILAPLLARPPSALNIVRSHHERYDGLGIPDGLQRQRDPARGAHRRRRRRARRHDERSPVSPLRDVPARGRSTRSAATLRTQFDPDVVEALTRAVASGDLQLLPKSSQANPLMPAL